MAFLRLCGLWPTKDAKTGKVVMSGKVLGMPVMILRADKSKRRSDKAPPFDLVFAEPQTERDAPAVPKDDDDIPF